MIPHPTTLAALARQRRAEHLAETDRYRLAQRAMDEGSAHRDWDAVVAVVLALALPVLASLWG
jgi:hypothetical protein